MIAEFAGSITIGWYILSDGSPADDVSLEMLERLEDALSGALPQSVDVYIDGDERPPVRVCFDLGGQQIEIEDGPVNGSLDDLRAALEDV